MFFLGGIRLVTTKGCLHVGNQFILHERNINQLLFLLFSVPPALSLGVENAAIVKNVIEKISNVKPSILIDILVGNEFFVDCNLSHKLICEINAFFIPKNEFILLIVLVAVLSSIVEVSECLDINLIYKLFVVV